MLGGGELPWDTIQEMGEAVGQLEGKDAASCVFQHCLGGEPRSWLQLVGPQWWLISQRWLQDHFCKRSGWWLQALLAHESSFPPGFFFFKLKRKFAYFNGIPLHLLKSTKPSFYWTSVWHFAHTNTGKKSTGAGVEICPPQVLSKPRQARLCPGTSLVPSCGLGGKTGCPARVTTRWRATCCWRTHQEGTA